MDQSCFQQISLDVTPYCHCISRCAHRAFPFGFDRYTYTSYEHRRAVIQQRLFELADIFCIDLAAYAILSNHHHCVLHINDEKAIKLTFDDTIERWHMLFMVLANINTTAMAKH